MKEAAADLAFEEAARIRDEIQRLQRIELLAEASPLFGLSRGGMSSTKPGSPGATSTRARRPMDSDMGPHNFGGGEARPLNKMAPRSTGGRPGIPTVKKKPK
jgi:excinuclease ABC subunit B